MKKIIFLGGFLSMCIHGTAQDQELRNIQGTAEKKIAEDTAHRSGWRKGLAFTLGVGQGGSRNWAAGAERFSFSIASYVSAYANLKSNKFSWRNTLDLGYALMNTTSQGTRKTDDKIDLFSKIGTELSKTVSLGVVANFRSQFYKGFDYNYLGTGNRRATSAFLAPAYIIVAPGIDWHPVEYFSIFFSPVSARFVVVSNDPRRYYYSRGIIPDSVKTPATGDYEIPVSVLYSVSPNKKVRREVGGFASVNFFKEVFKNISYRSRLDLYSNYLRSSRYTVIGPDQISETKVPSSPEKVDVFWTNLLIMKVNNFLNVSYGFDLIYDDDVRQFGPNNTSPATQFRSQLTIGISAKL